MSDSIRELLEEVLDLEDGEFDEDTNLEELDEWDSLAKLSLMAEAKKTFGVMISAEEMKSFVTVGDIVRFLTK